MSADAAMQGRAGEQFGTMLRRLLQSGQWDRALEVARDWLSQDPESADAHLAAGQALVNLKQFAAAEKHIGKVLASRPNNGFALRLASIACFHENKTAKADEFIQRAIELQPNDAMHWYQLALMRYRQGSLEAAEKHAKRALELQPQNANTINLIANCQRGNPRGQLEQYLRALEIDPENGVVHNNIGIYYLNSARDYAAAEASFRRALQCDPTDRTAQKNLFTVLRIRDPIYRVLTLPPRLLGGVSWSRADRTTMARIGLLLLWVCMGRYFLLVFGLWLAMVAPLVKAYEYLTLSDIRAKAGIVGARRGGFQGSHQWPLWVRLGIFGLLLLCFWGFAVWVYVYEGGPVGRLIIEEVVVVALVAWFGFRVYLWSKRRLARAAANRAEKKFQRSSRRAKPDIADPH